MVFKAWRVLGLASLILFGQQLHADSIGNNYDFSNAPPQSYVDSGSMGVEPAIASVPGDGDDQFDLAADSSGNLDDSGIVQSQSATNEESSGTSSGDAFEPGVSSVAASAPEPGNLTTMTLAALLLLVTWKFHRVAACKFRQWR